METIGYAASGARSPLAPFTFKGRELRDDDIAIEIDYCGVCHSDLHQARDDWKDYAPTVYPLVPGHEIVGRVIATGGDVTRYGIGDVVAVGVMVDSCQHCDQCLRGEQQMCREVLTGTFNAHDRSITRGGYSRHIVVREDFVYRVPDGLDASKTAPLLCAGITVYSPMRQWNVGPGSRVAVVGIGGLGHLAVRFATALGATVTAITRSAEKAAEAHALGASATLISTSARDMEKAAASFDLIIDTIPIGHDLNPYLPLLDIEGALVIVGAVTMMEGFHSLPVAARRLRVTGSPGGGVPQTQEMLDFCAANGILPDCEMIAMDEINDAFGRLERGDVRYRFVIDMSSLRKT